MDNETLPATPALRAGFIAPLRDIEWRKTGKADSDDLTFTGSAIVYNSWSEPLWTPLGSFRERILPGAFDDILARKPDVRLLKNHNSDFVMARTKSGTLELTSDEDALRVWARVAPTSYALDLRMAMERRDIDQMSFAMEIDEENGAEERWYEDEDSGEILRDIIRASELFDVSPVTFPAYVNTTAAMRELELRSAAEAGKINLPTYTAQAEITYENDPKIIDIAAQPGRDAAGDATPGDTSEAAPAETDPVEVEVDPLAALRAYTSEATQRERESYLRLLKEITK